ncbi:hypothetical protein F503_00326 [Ophiostoma piceae UAMH 11346]|uniref:Uncharacterized protein n=1 Tax=Ophiostoma piceae (strain UAMH 11346) TaxID=1262450 RepID=S3C244_OPHP1|nr:hypothetical protein F503_00326 [Ophiostoma piceae UAMH 11346]
MRDDERERMQSRFGNRAFWQNHNDRTHARACANVPSGNPFVPRPNGPNIHQPVPGYGQGSQQDGQLSAVAQWLQAAHTGPGEPRHDQHQADWDDDEGYSSADGLDLNPPPPQNVHFIIPQSNNRNNGFQPGAGASCSTE